MFEERSALATTAAHEVALDCLEAAIRAADPETVVRESLDFDGSVLRIDGDAYDLSEYDRVIVLGGGNAAGRVASALESLLGDAIDEGVVVTDNPTDTTVVEQVEGDHPVPSEGSVRGAERVRALAGEADAETLVLAVVTGGGSALLASPADGVDLSDLRATTAALLESGATIGEINAVRKHCSRIKGGQLARAVAPARTVALVFSDVVGDDLGTIASGPLAPDDSTYEDALAVVERYGVDLPSTVREHLEAGRRGDRPETPGDDDPAFGGVDHHVLADNVTALAAARDVAADRGIETLVLSSRVEGEAREAAKTHVAVAAEALATGDPVEPPAVVLSGGETTVTVRGDGTGGPNQEFALQVALGLPPGVVLASVDSDGIDGSTDAAGAIVDDATVADDALARDALADNDAYPYLDERDALLFSGFTGTNVNDVRVMVVGVGD